MVRTAQESETLSQPASTPVEAGVVEPLACLNAMSALASMVANVGEFPATVGSIAAALPSRRDGFIRFLAAFVTGAPQLIAELACTFVSFMLANRLVSLNFSSHRELDDQSIALFCFAFTQFGFVFGLYPGTGINPVAILRMQTLAVCFSSAVVLFSVVVAGQLAMPVFISLLAGSLLCCICLPFIRSWVRRYCVRFAWWGERAIVVGASDNALAIYEFLHENSHLGLRPAGVVDDYSAAEWLTAANHEIPLLGPANRVASICRENKCSWVIVTTAGSSMYNIEHYLNSCCLNTNLIVVNDAHPLPNLWANSFDAAGMSGVQIRHGLLHPMARVTKRVIDVVLSLLLLILTCPIFAVIAVCTKLLSPGPVFFGDERIGRRGVRFRVFKFRSMVANADVVFARHMKTNPEARLEWEQTQKLKNDPRIIPILGHTLRQWSLDELPQLLNVLRGDMSLVGPRPIMPDEAAKYGPAYQPYTCVRPGLTGLWQVCGRNGTSYEARLQLVTYYVRNWSLWLDYYILLRTIRTVITRQGSC